MNQVPSFSHGITIYGKLNHIEINASNYHVLSMFISAIWYFVYINTWNPPYTQCSMSYFPKDDN